MTKASHDKRRDGTREKAVPPSGRQTRASATQRGSGRARAHAAHRETDANSDAGARVRSSGRVEVPRGASRAERGTTGASRSAIRGAAPRAAKEKVDLAGYTGPQPAQTSAPVWQRRILVERPADLVALTRELERAHVVALDAEFAQPRVRAPDEPPHRLALLQIAFDDAYRASYVVDALRLADLSPLRAIFANPAILKVFHGIGADSRVLATRELLACNTLDIEAVSRSLFGQHESGLQRMLQRAANVRLDKSLQRADWARRPLTPAMVAYAARDAEMTYALYGWLSVNYPAMMALQHIAADEPAPGIAAWILPYLEGSRPRPAAAAIAEAGIAEDLIAQERDLRAALLAVRHPSQRARVMRLIADLDLRALAQDLRLYLDAPAAEERSGAARTIGRLGDRTAILLLRPLLEDSVQDVRQAAQIALEHLEQAIPRRAPTRPHPPAPTGDTDARPRARGRDGSVRWSSDAAGDTEGTSEADWQRQLRLRYGRRDASADESS